ncbi:hypothetical protein ACCO45_004373 [Purpureocillium lilacinum]|uniref:Uncharacterized protein n=1 Tax=Purpureocillium lilacinum TaxID=33203 RepID=A0ACC4E2J2_PURLI
MRLRIPNRDCHLRPCFLSTARPPELRCFASLCSAVTDARNGTRQLSASSSTAPLQLVHVPSAAACDAASPNKLPAAANIAVQSQPGR